MIDALAKLISTSTASGVAVIAVIMLVIVCVTLYNIIEVIVNRPRRKN